MITRTSLENLEQSCFELLNFTWRVQSNINNIDVRNSRDRIITAMRKVIIANQMMGQGIICVTGLQGAGKTTLMKNLYQIQDGVLNVSLGRGENLPIFIREKKMCKELSMKAICVIDEANGGFSKKEIELDTKQFHDISAGDGYLEPNIQIMYLEIQVPFRHICNESFAFVLLPGVEKKLDKWQALIDFSVRCSDTAVFVFDGSSFSMESNRLQLEKAKNRFGENLLYVISHSDSSSDGNAETKGTCMEELKIPTNQSNRVICAGDYHYKEDNDKWISSLKDAITIYGNAASTSIDYCTDYIREVIEEEIGPALDDIESAVKMSDNDIILIHLETSALLKAFDQVVEDRKNKLDKIFERELNLSIHDSCNSLEEQFKQKHIMKKVKRNVFGESIGDIKSAREAINVAIQQPDSELYRYELAFARAIGSNYTEIETNNRCREIFSNEEIMIIDIFDSSNTNSLNDEVAIKIFEDVKSLLDNSKEHKNQLKYPDIASIMRAIAEISTQYYGIVMGQQLVSEKPEANIVFEKMQLSTEAFSADFGAVEKFFLGALGITGIDILEDGAINAIPKIAATLGVSIPILSLAVVTVASITGGVALIRDVNRLQRCELEYSKQEIVSIHNKVKDSYLDSYSNAMKLVRDRIEENLLTIYDVNREMHNKINIQISIHNINLEVDKILRQLTTKTIQEF